jgi:hypothetical protein
MWRDGFADDPQLLAIASRRSRLSAVRSALLYALVFFVPVWLFEYQRAERTKVALEVQQLQRNLTTLESARRAAAAQLEQLRRLDRVEGVAQGELALARVPVDHVLPDARRDVIPAAKPAPASATEHPLAR